MKRLLKIMIARLSPKNDVFFLTLISVALIACLGSSSANAQATPTPYKMSGAIGSVLDSDLSSPTKALSTFIEAIEKEGWKATLTYSFAITHRAYRKLKGEKLSDIVVEKSKGCESFDKDCLRYIGNLNRRLESLSDDYEGEVVLPTQELRFVVSIDAGSNYREERSVGRATQAFISKRLHDLSQMIDLIAYARISQICFGECTDLYQLTIE